MEGAVTVHMWCFYLPTIFPTLKNIKLPLTFKTNLYSLNKMVALLLYLSPLTYFHYHYKQNGYFNIYFGKHLFTMLSTHKNGGLGASFIRPST